MMKFTKKEKIGYTLLGLGLTGSGLYSLFLGVGGGIPGLSGHYDKGIFPRIVGLIMAMAGTFIISKVMKSPTIPPKDDSNK